MINYLLINLSKAKYLLFFLLILPYNVKAGIHPEKYLSDSLEQRASNLFIQINCPVCQGQNIVDSFVPISKQIRQIVREMLQAGKSDKEIKNYLRANFGKSIINVVEFKLDNIYLVLLPLILIIFGLYVISKFSRRKQSK